MRGFVELALFIHLMKLAVFSCSSKINKVTMNNIQSQQSREPISNKKNGSESIYFNQSERGKWRVQRDRPRRRASEGRIVKITHSFGALKAKGGTLVNHSNGSWWALFFRDAVCFSVTGKTDFFEPSTWAPLRLKGLAKQSKLFYLNRTHHTTKRMVVSLCTLHPPPPKMVSRLYSPHG